MKLKQIKFLFKTLFRKPEGSITVKVYQSGTLMDVRGTGKGLFIALDHILDSEELKPIIAEVQANLVKRKIGIDPREVIAHAMEGATTEHFGHPHKHKEEKRKTVN